MMERRDKVTLILHLSLVGSSSLLFFDRISIESYYAGFILLVGIFAVPLVSSLTGNLGRPAMVTILTITPIFSMLIVADPVEIGLFGYDSYFNLASYREFLNSGSLQAIFDHGDWPLFFIFVSTLGELIGVSGLFPVKYIPLIAGLSPFLFFVVLTPLLGRRPAFVVGLSFASVRTLIIFESKFVDESLAIFFLFVLILTIRVRNQQGRQTSGLFFNSIVIILSTAVSLSHHAIGLFSIIFISIWWIGSHGIESKYLPPRLQPVTDNITPSLVPVLVGGTILTILFLYPSSYLTSSLIQRIFESVTVGSGGTVAGPTAGTSSLRSQISTASVAVLFICVLITVYGIFSKTKQAQWMISWTGFAGLMGGCYTATLILGTFIPLDPIRFLIPFSSILLAITMAALMKDPTFSNYPRMRTSLVAIIFAGFIVTQLAAIPPHVLYSNPSESTLDEGHYSPQQFEASEWVSNYSHGQGIYVYEDGLWRSAGVSNTQPAFLVDSDCHTALAIWRQKGPRKYPVSQNVLYSSGNTAIWLC